MASRPSAYPLFKFGIFALLSVNVALFLLEDASASVQTFQDGVSWRNFVDAYSRTVDTVAWLLLLLMFELETSTISDEKLKGALIWVLTITRAVCYAFIVYACYGYMTKYGLVTNVTPLVADPCSLVGSNLTYPRTLDEYFPITPEICRTIQGKSLYQIVGTTVVGTPEIMSLLGRLALTDVLNSVAWLLTVAILEAEVWLQLRNRLTAVMAISRHVKSVFYLVLLACAIYWWIDGDFLDFWDAFLWLVAFVFIDLNIFKWQAETTRELKYQETRGAAR